jgi:endogenous inhibitor of DNA gyrase (YacG/DUF329 family)
MERNHCPHCGADVTDVEETEYGIFCPNGCGDFWRSETIPASELSQYTHNAKHNMMMRAV